MVNFPHSRAVREMTCGKFSRGKLDAGNAGNFEGEKTVKRAIFLPKMECETKSDEVLYHFSSSKVILMSKLIFKKIFLH